jgi:predicted Rossmann fold nucleotide-binding protein DprA/Smf involved in DNA uptake
MAGGSNELIKAGATLVTDASDILSVLGISDIPHGASQKISASNPEEYTILRLISNGIHHTDDLLDKSNLGAEIFNQTLTMLEITGRIKPGGGATWYLTNL